MPLTIKALCFAILCLMFSLVSQASPVPDTLPSFGFSASPFPPFRASAPQIINGQLQPDSKSQPNANFNFATPLIPQGPIMNAQAGPYGMAIQRTVVDPIKENAPSAGANGYSPLREVVWPQTIQPNSQQPPQQSGNGFFPSIFGASGASSKLINQQSLGQPVSGQQSQTQQQQQQQPPLQKQLLALDRMPVQISSQQGSTQDSTANPLGVSAASLASPDASPAVMSGASSIAQVASISGSLVVMGLLL
ncbi:uncharacterized protein VTP21DRAFT_4606 [Calcarisporiella thermophila]|uniref:uncharacterized protein n=1 Tax=Calcarisporiella thermophila TaxID=911321 RepID=UPI003743BC4A